jgi:hypothetical protein
MLRLELAGMLRGSEQLDLARTSPHISLPATHEQYILQAVLQPY